MPRFLNKKALIISLISLILFILAGLAVYFLNQKQAAIPSAGEKKEETLAEKQVKELEELRNQAGVPSLTEEQKVSQLSDLEVLRKEANIKPLTPPAPPGTNPKTAGGIR